MSESTRDTMDCTDIKALLSALLDDATSAEARHRAERHLAECPACRKLVDAAERNEVLLAAAAAFGGDRLPEGFETTVLRRTTLPGRRRGSRVFGWTGWLAAAAALLLSASLWLADGPARGGGAQLAATGASGGGADAGRWQDEAPRAPGGGMAAPVLVNEVADYVLDDSSRSIRTAGAVRALAPELTARETEALAEASVLLARLGDGGGQSFAGVEEVRRITVYDDLLPRLAEARAALPAEHRPAVLAAESILYRVAEGPLNLDDVRELRRAADRLDLPRRLGALAGRRPAPPSL